jgi:predicted HNH restriction endonuclease
MERKPKLCGDIDCDNTFYQYKSTDKYCSFECHSKNQKKKDTTMKHNTLKRTPLKLSQKSIDKIKAKAKAPKKKSEFDLEFEKQSKKIKKRLVKEHGKVICERCATDSSIQFSVHHIIYRSERPKHPALNTLENLIHLCFDCHEWFHLKKIRRNYLIAKRKLTGLFGRIWGYDNNNLID